MCQACWNGYYMFEKQCNQSYTQRLEMKLMLVNVMVVQVLFYGVEVWDDTTSLSAWLEIEKIQILFFCRQGGINSSTSHLVVLIEIGAQLVDLLCDAI